MAPIGSLHLGAGRPASKENLKNGFLVLDISGSLLRAIPHPRPVHGGGRIAQPPLDRQPRITLKNLETVARRGNGVRPFAKHGRPWL